MKLNKTLLFLCLLSLFSWVILTSIHPNIDSFLVQGKIEALNGTVNNAKIRYTQDKSLTDVSEMKEFDVWADGSFSKVLNLESRGMVYFYVIKEGYTISKVSAILENRKAANVLKTIYISLLYEPSLQDVPKIPIYADMCLTEEEQEVSLKDIFFENLAIKTSTLCQDSDPNLTVLSAKVNIPRTQKLNKNGYLAFKESNGNLLVAGAIIER